MTTTAENAETSFKCAKCGHIFATAGKHKATCPLCGFACDDHKCEVMGASNEDY